MHAPNGMEFNNRIGFEEIVKPERMVYAHGEDDAPGQFHVTVTFANQDGKTRLTLRSVCASAAERDKVVKEYGAIEGGNQTLDRLAEHLARMG
ncbi:MAG: hypothetical protein JWN85_3026 [Gammaproteobacteria bacterium]|nr:hypothetical protein [Gammaproteobacteria bacterium]